MKVLNSCNLPAFICAAMFWSPLLQAQEINANLFTHFEYDSSDAADAADRSLEWGESALFLTGNLTGKLSFLGEFTYTAPKYTDKSFSAHRYRLRYEFNRDNAVSIGKMHTPVNYWNDNFHHGRIFFPTINRPRSFARFIPIHEVGVRFSGMSPMVEGVGYDIVLGTGQSEGDDAFGQGVQSYTVTFNWAPSVDSRAIVSYYRDTILDHEDNPFHSGHNHGGSDPMGMDHMGMGQGDMNMDHGDSGSDIDIPYELLSFSLHHEDEYWRTLTEISANRTDGGDWNWAVYQYAGYHISDELSVYALYDYVDVGDGEIHFRPGTEKRAGLGLEWFVTDTTSLKIEARSEDKREGAHIDDNVLEAQLSFAF
jgi:hypothetical protein